MFYIRHPTLPCAIKVMKGLCRTVLFTRGCWASGFPVACLSSRQAPQMTHALPTALEIPRYTRWHLSWLSYTCSLDLLGPSRQYPSPMESSNLFVPLRIRSDRLMKHAWSNRHRLRRMYPDPGIGAPFYILIFDGLHMLSKSPPAGSKLKASCLRSAIQRFSWPLSSWRGWSMT